MKAIINANIITSGNDFREFFGFLTFENGKIISLSPGEYTSTGNEEEIIDAEGSYLMPGLIDAHTHLGV